MSDRMPSFHEMAMGTPTDEPEDVLGRLRYRIDYEHNLAMGDCDPQIYPAAEAAYKMLKDAQELALAYYRGEVGDDDVGPQLLDVFGISA